MSTSEWPPENRARQTGRRGARLKTVGELVLGFTHDLGNLLGALSIRLLRQEALIAEQAGLTIRRANLQEMRRILDDAAMLGRQLESFARGSDRRLQAVNLSASIESALLLSQTALRLRAREQGAELHFERDVAPVPDVLARPSDLEQLFVRLFIKAADAMPGGGTVRVRARRAGGRVLVQVEEVRRTRSRVAGAARPRSQKSGATVVELRLAPDAKTSGGGPPDGRAAQRAPAARRSGAKPRARLRGLS